MIKVMFNNQTVKTCTPPTEQKVFKGGIPIGWLVVFQITENISSTELDILTTPENILTLTFTNADDEPLFVLSGYEKLSSAVIRYDEDSSKTIAELQFTKGV